MTDQQIIAIAITVLAVLAGSIFNNVRISDLNSGLSARISDTKEVMRAELHQEIGQLRLESERHWLEAERHRLEIFERFTSIDRKLDELLRLSAHHDGRITALETRPH